jgi:hypothetical protein
MATAGTPVLKYLKQELNNLLMNRDFIDAIPGHVFDRVNVDERVEKVKPEIINFVKLIERRI